MSGVYITQDGQERKQIPLTSGVLDYFPAALAYVARISKAGNDKHNPGQPLHHARGKSMDHADCIARHLIDRGGFDPEDGLRHTGKLAWRALAALQEELEREEGAPLARGAHPPAIEAPAVTQEPALVPHAGLPLSLPPESPLAAWVRAVTPLDPAPVPRFHLGCE